MAMTSYNDSAPGSLHPVASNTSLSSSSGAVEAIEMDPSSGASFFNASLRKNDDLKQMLDSNKDSLKLEAMKRIIALVARGRDAGDLFPAVVKNVVSKNIEVKKLVYVYLTRYAEEQQDLALLSISTFQRALKDPNQLIRASALRVLSSIRVPVIVPIMMLAIRDSAVDMSPFVRKTAAHAIPKLFSLDPDQKEELVSVIEKLLGDRTTLVVGSAVMAFEEVCPERIELIHKNFRKLCNLLVDVEEWGQVIILNMLTRYARTQFVDPNLGNSLEDFQSDKNFYESSDDEEDIASSSKKKSSEKLRMDNDHRLLLRSAKPLLQSRNASVVMATAQLYHHCAPKTEVQVVAKAMIRLLRSHREVQAVVLNCIASMTSMRDFRNKMFEPYIRNFFVSSSDPSYVKDLKLEILTNMSSESNIGLILREFQSYITGQDKACIAATIQAIGRCAASIEEVTDTCLNGLVHLLSNKDEAVVAESIVVIKKLLQTQSGDHKAIIVQMSKLVDTISVPAARAAILWLIGEYSERVPNIAPDVLRKVAKTFIKEEPEVKLQILNLATKLSLTNRKQTDLLCQYVFNLARYDQNYDIRDRARFMRVFIFPPAGQENNVFIKQSKKIFLSTKRAPVLESKFKDREAYQLGSLSHFLNSRANGYQDLPEFPAEAPDPSVRNVEPPKAVNPWSKSSTKFEKNINSKFFSSDNAPSTTSSGSESDSSDSSTSSSGSGSGSDASSESESETEVKALGKKRDPETSGNTKEKVNGLDKQLKRPVVKAKEKSESPSETDSSEESSSEEEKSSTKPRSSKPQTNLDLLLDLSDTPPSNQGSMLAPSAANPLSPQNPDKRTSPDGGAKEAVAVFTSTKSKVLLNKVNTGGLEVTYRYTRSPHLYSPNMTNIELTMTNHSNDDLSDIKIGAKQLSSGMSLHEFPGIPKLAPGSSVNVKVGINFADTLQTAKFDLVVSGRCHSISISPEVGELIKAIQVPENFFNVEKSKLKGMNETSMDVDVPSANANDSTVRQKVYEVANVLQVPSSDDNVLKFAAQTTASNTLVLIELRSVEGTKKKIVICTEKIVIGSMLAKDIKKNLETV